MLDNIVKVIQLILEKLQFNSIEKIKYLGKYLWSQNKLIVDFFKFNNFGVQSFVVGYSDIEEGREGDFSRENSLYKGKEVWYN